MNIRSKIRDIKDYIVTVITAQKNNKIIVRILYKLNYWFNYISENIIKRIEGISLLKGNISSPNKISHRPIIAGVILVFIFIMMFIIWGSIAPINSASIAQGIVVLDFNKKTIQHLEGGIIERILIKEGDYVVTGQNLILLQNIQAQATQNIYKKQFFTNKAMQIRLNTEKDYSKQLNLDIIRKESSNIIELDNIIHTQYDIYNIRKAAYLGKIDILKKRILQLNTQIQALQSQKLAANKQLKIMYHQLEAIIDLTKINNISVNEKFELEKQIADLEGKKGSFIAEIAKTEQTISETELEIINFKKEHLNAILQELQEVETQISNLSEQVISAEDVLKRTIIKSPSSGIIMNLNFHNIGAVISPGSEIMQIVPQDEELIIEIRIKPQDIDLVNKGLKAKVNFSAFKAKKIPKLDGELLNISADIIFDEVTGEQYFLGRIKITEDAIRSLKKDIRLYPGMPAEAYIITGSRSLMSYLLSPIKNATYKAFRD